jgi:hypothetical protein
MFPVTNWVSFVGTTDGPYWYTNFKKLPWEDVTEHWQRSPLRLVGNVTQDEYHGAGQRHPSNRIRRMLYTEAWFRKHRVGAGAAGGTSDGGAPARGTK